MHVLLTESKKITQISDFRLGFGTFAAVSCRTAAKDAGLFFQRFVFGEAGIIVMIEGSYVPGESAKDYLMLRLQWRN